MDTFLTLHGSLRTGSHSGTVLAALGSLLRERGAEQVTWDGLAELPAYNPDLDPAEDGAAVLPQGVHAFRTAAESARGLVVVSPEYARGYPGFLKNGLDWLVGSQAVFDRPAAVVTASPGWKGGELAADGLAAVLTMMGASPLHTLSIGQVVLKVDGGRVVDGPTLAALSRLADRLLAGR